MSSNQHYVFFSRTLPFHGIGGMEIVVWDLLTEISRSGQGRVTVVTTTIPDKPEKFVEEGVNVVAIPGVKPRRYTRKFWRLSADYFDQNLRKDTTCVVSVAMGVCGLLFQREQFSDVPIVWQAHGSVVGEVISKLRTRNPIQILKCLRQIKYFIREYRALRKVDKIVTVGKIVERTFKSKPYTQYLNEEKIILIENGIDIRKFHPSSTIRDELRNKYNICLDGPLIISASRLILQKGITQGILGFQKFLEKVPNAHLLIIGDGPDKNKFQQLVVKCSLDNKVTFAGAKPYSQMPQYFQMGDIFLFPTLRVEGAPLNILEALATGLSVVASEYLHESQCISPYIYIVDARNAEEVASGLFKAHQALNQNVVELSKKYSIQGVTTEYVNLFESLSR